MHCFMDGRDTPPASGAGYIAQLEQKMREYGVGKVASVNGRYYAMDRDKRWERERKAFDAMVTGKAEGGAYPNAVRAHDGELQQRRHRRVHHSLCGGRCRGQAGWRRFATRTSASTSTSAPTAPARLPAC